MHECRYARAAYLQRHLRTLRDQCSCPSDTRRKTQEQGAWIAAGRLGRPAILPSNLCPIERTRSAYRSADQHPQATIHHVLQPE